MKRFLVLFLTLAITSISMAQSNDWQLYKAIDGVEIYSKLEDCVDNQLPEQRAVILKVVNTNSTDVTVDWDLMIWYSGKLITTVPQNPEYHFSFIVPKNSSVEGNCDMPRGAFYIMKEWISLTNTRKLSRFELDNIQVKR